MINRSMLSVETAFLEAMHDRRIADIERALLAAEECRLYPMELEHARHTLLEAQKACSHRLFKLQKQADAVYKLEKTLFLASVDSFFMLFST